MLKARIMEIFTAYKQQWLIFAAIAGIILILTLVLFFWDKVVFTSLLGRANPIFVAAGAAFIGVLCFLIFLDKGWFFLGAQGGRRGYVAALGLSFFFLMNAILLDWRFRFERDINVLPPKGLFYYPVMGFIVEMLFHLMLLTIVMIIFTGLLRGQETNTAIWISILLVSLAEPIFQVAISIKQGSLDLFALLTGAHIFLINLGQLAIFKYYGFSATFFLRMSYYLWWHVIWGVLRLKIFF